MKKQIVIIGLIILNLFFLIFQLSDKSELIEIVAMEGEYYPFFSVADGENIYFIGIRYTEEGSIKESKICCMKKGERHFRVMQIEPPEKMIFCNLSMDFEKNLNVFLSDNQNKNCKIWKLSTDGEVIKEIDVTKYISQCAGYGISAFAIDNQGRYYLREYTKMETLVLDQDGKELCKIKDGNRGFHCLGNSGNGKVYALYDVPAVNPVRLELNSVNVSEKRLDVESTGDFLPLEDIYSSLQAGKKCDFLISGSNGAYKYNLGEQKAKKVIDSFYIEQFEYNSAASCFLNDEQLLLIAKKQFIGQKMQYGNVRFCYYAF